MALRPALCVWVAAALFAGFAMLDSVAFAQNREAPNGSAPLNPGTGAPAAAAPLTEATVPPRYKSEYRLSTGVGTTYAWGKGAETWARLVKERTGGRINVRLQPGYSAVGGDAQREFAALADGTLDLAVGSALAWSTSVKSFGLFALPLFFADNRALDAVLHGETGAFLLQQAAAAGIVPLAFGDNGFHALSSAERTLRRPEDFAGRKLRTSGHPIVDDALRALGAQPVRIPWSDAQQALQSGDVHGQETTLPAFVATKSETLGQRHVSRLDFAAEPLVFAVSRAAWESWSEADRVVVRQAAVDAAAFEIAAARAADDAAEKAILALRGAGVTLDRPTAAERAALVAALAAVTARWSADVGIDLVERARHAAGPSPAR